MSTLKLSLLLSLVFLSTACSEIAPFEDRRREPGTEYVYVGASKPGKPAVCYNPLFNGSERAQEIADNLCHEYNPETHALKRNTDIFSCRLFVPSRAYYECVKEK